MAPHNRQIANSLSNRYHPTPMLPVGCIPIMGQEMLGVWDEGVLAVDHTALFKMTGTMVHYGSMIRWKLTASTHPSGARMKGIKLWRFCGLICGLGATVLRGSKDWFKCPNIAVSNILVLGPTRTRQVDATLSLSLTLRSSEVVLWRGNIYGWGNILDNLGI